MCAPDTSVAAEDPEPLLTQTDILLDVGHGGIDSGTLHQHILEKDINLQISRIVYNKLQAKGYKVVMNRLGDYALSDDNRWLRARSRHTRDLAHRSKLANDLKPKAMISIHVNWSPKKHRRGGIVLHQKSSSSILLAQSIQNRLNEFYGMQESIVRGKTFYLLNYSKVPSVIAETGFISNASDRQLLTDPKGQELIAQTIAAGIDDYMTAIHKGVSETNEPYSKKDNSSSR
jgi:N-acetylmuramoyl-L-alanine amidase CwlD